MLQCPVRMCSCSPRNVTDVLLYREKRIVVTYLVAFYEQESLQCCACKWCGFFLGFCFFYSGAPLIFVQHNLDYSCSQKWKTRFTKSWLVQSIPLIRLEVLTNLQSFWSRASAVTVRKQLKRMSFIKTVNLFELLLCLHLPARLLSNI